MHSYLFLYSKFSHPVNLYFQTLTQIVVCFVSPFKIYKITHCQLNPTVKQKATRTQKSRGLSGLHKMETHHFIFCWPCIFLWFLVNDQIDANFYLMCLFQYSTRFEQPRAHYQENQLYQYSIWYTSICVGDRFVCRSPICTWNGASSWSFTKETHHLSVT
jgi:hypothetical protein